MKCSKCHGTGILEEEYGLVQYECDGCGGTGELNIGERVKAIVNHPVTQSPKPKMKSGKKRGSK